MAKNNFLVFDGVGFNKDLIKKLSVEEFLASSEYDHIWTKLNKTDRKRRFRELYKLATIEPK